jgi:uncharacterized protein (TIGR03545 family)
VSIAWWLYADTLVQRGVEASGEAIVGARVELESADIRPTEGAIRLTGLQVANPEAPMSNLLEAEQIVVDLLLEPLLTKNVVVQQLTVTGVRFNTPRETSGALENPDPESGALWRQINGWADQVEIPELSLETLTETVRTEALSADSLRTVRYAREALARADSMRRSWQAQVEALDPTPRIDSLRAVVRRLEEFRPTPLNAVQLPGLVRDGRNAVERLTALQSEVARLDDTVRDGLSSVAVGPDVISELRAQDLAYARSLLNIPSLDAPTLSPALFGSSALAWMKPVLYWAHAAERFLPPGLDPRNRPGPRRARAEGTTVEFPGRATYPRFLLQQGEIGLEIGGTGAAAGSYTALLSQLSTSPSLVGEPMELTLGRRGGATGLQGVSLSAVLDHTGSVLRDSATLGLSGVSLPEFGLGSFGGRLDLGSGESAFSVRRIGEDIDASLRVVSGDVSWTRPATLPPADAPRPSPGTREWALDLVWRTLTGVRQVEIDMGLRGSIANPSLTVSSNLGQALAESLQRELGAQIAEAEARVRAEVERHIQPVLEDARTRVEGIRTGIADRVAGERQEIDALRARLEQRVNELGRGIV